MKTIDQEVLLSIIAITIVLILLVTAIVVFSVLFQRRQNQFREEKKAIQEAHQREILQAQLETQNQTLQHVADELHDHVGQMLAVVVLYLNALHDDTGKTPYQEKVAKLLLHTTTLVNDVRALSKSLSTDTVARFGLVACLALEIEQINRAERAEQAVMQVLGEPYVLGEQTEIILLRMVQEALNNALKYAYEAAITLTIDYQPDTLLLTIADQGPGFSMSEVEARPLARSGQGLHNLRRRALLLGGTCTWQTAPQQGTRVCLRIPRIALFKTAHMTDDSIVTN